MFVELHPFPYYFYILTNKNKTVLYCGVTNNLQQRLLEHKQQEGNIKSFTGRYNCHFLIYYEGFSFINDAIRREKEVKAWRREKKELLINVKNPQRNFLNDSASFD